MSIDLLIYALMLGLSFMIERAGWTTQGLAFCYIYAGYIAIQCIIALMIAVYPLNKFKIKAKLITCFALILNMLIVVGLEFGLAWILAKIFQVDFFISFQIMYAGICLHGLTQTNKK